MQGKTNAARLDWGNGKALDLVTSGIGRFELTFDKDVPDTSKIKVEAIEIMGKCRPLMVSSVVNGKTVTASGQTDNAYRARVAIVEDGKPQIREISIPGTVQMKYARGPNGGALVYYGHDGDPETAEIVQDGNDWKVIFASKGAAQKAPVPEEIEMEAIGPANSADQVRRLNVSAGSDQNSLRAAGNTKGADYVRFAIKAGAHWHIRCVPLH